MNEFTRRISTTRKKNYLFYIIVLILCPLKTSENLCFSDEFMGCGNGVLAWYELVKPWLFVDSSCLFLNMKYCVLQNPQKIQVVLLYDLD